MLFVWWMGCGGPDGSSTEGQRTVGLARTVDGVLVPDCTLARDCPSLGIPEGRCVDDPSWFEVTTIEDEVVDVRMTEAANLSGLAEGTWYTTVGVADACDRVVVTSFVAGDAP